MELIYEGFVTNEIQEAAKQGDIFPHMVCGIDTYLPPNEGQNVDLDMARPCPRNDRKFFAGRGYRIFHLRDPDEYDPHSTIPELRERLIELGAKGAGFLEETLLESDDSFVAYMATPLTEEEMKTLMR
ncbi:TPA: hypothetical protein HA278_06070 [Candidatus Woesearchaeota archaeon]|nr:hypothetical protein [archaeon]HIJ11598.1 hypothetical protein [Candidatus Woesearchaeota archaeon]